MDNYKVYFYVIIFVIWLINQIRKSGKSNTIREEANLPETQAPKPLKSPAPLLSQNKPAKRLIEKPVVKKAFKFDDFFDELDKNSKEISKTKKAKIPASSYQPAGYENEIIDEEENIKLKLQKDQLAAINHRKHGVHLADEHIQHYSSKETSPRNKYEEMLKNPQDLKNALILSEILNRKY